MSVAATMKAISIITDLTTVAADMIARTNRLSNLIRDNGGDITDAHWQELVTEDEAASLRLVAAIAQRKAGDSEVKKP